MDHEHLGEGFGEEDGRTASCENGAVDVLQEAAIGQIQGSDDVAPNDLFLVVLAPVDIRPAGTASTVEDMCRFDTIKFCNDSFSVLHTHSCREDFLVLLLQELFKMASNPPFTSPNQEDFVGATIGTRGAVCGHCVESIVLGPRTRVRNWEMILEDRDRRRLNMYQNFRGTLYITTTTQATVKKHKQG